MQSRTTLPLAAAAAALLALPARADDNLPTLQEVLGPLPGPPAVLLDDGGKPFAEIWGAKHLHVVRLAEIPAHLRQALIDTEDPTFYGNPGFDPKGIARALFKNLMAGKAKEGGSTLTQQLAKTLLGDRSRTMNRKVKEAWLTVQLERQFTKDAILERYLNEVYFGHGAYGAGAAAEVYFDRPVSQLSLGQAALLVALLKGPAAYDPFDDRRVRAGADRQAYVLDRMVAHGHLSPAEAARASHRRGIAAISARAARKETTPARAAARIRQLLGLADDAGRSFGVGSTPGVRGRARSGAWFGGRVADVLVTRHGPKTVAEGGLTVRTTMDPGIQRAAEEAAARGILRDGKKYGFSQVAIVAIEPGSGKVRALVGGVGATEYDRTMARLQPGSSFKPFVYLTAFGLGLSPDEPVVDAPVRYPAGPGKWYEPRNDDGRHRGPTSLRVALEHSINVVAVDLLARVGIGEVIETSRKFGLVSPLEPDLTMALGSSAVTPLELATAYAGFANDGIWVQPVIHTDVTAPNGQSLQRPVPRQVRAAEPEPVRMLVSVLQGVIERGTATGAALGRPAAGKTGTTDRFRDAWFVGFTPQLCVAVWVGNDDRKPMRQGAFGGRVGARIWKDVMIAAHRGMPILAFPKPLPIPPPFPFPLPIGSPFPSQPPPDSGPLWPVSRPASYDGEATP